VGAAVTSCASSSFGASRAEIARKSPVRASGDFNMWGLGESRGRRKAGRRGGPAARRCSAGVRGGKAAGPALPPVVVGVADRADVAHLGEEGADRGEVDESRDRRLVGTVDEGVRERGGTVGGVVAAGVEQRGGGAVGV